MKIEMKEFSCIHKLYHVFLDNGEQIETIVTRNAATVKTWICNAELINKCRLDRLIVGLDIEWRPLTGPDCVHPAATLQLCVGKSCLIFQIIHADRIPSQLRKFLENPDYTFVGVGIKSDINKIEEDYGLEVANRRDLRHWAADELDRKEMRGFGLKALVREVIGEELQKPNNVTMSRWDDRVLTTSQVAYACLDAYFSFEVGRVLSSWY